MVSINETSDITTEVAEKPSRTYALNLDTGRIIGHTDGIDAVKQYIRKTLITPRFGCLIYGDNYGSEIDNMLAANGWNRILAKRLLPKLIKDALTDSRIVDVYDFEYTDGKGDVLEVNFKVDTVFGVTEVKEVINIV